MSDVFDNCEKNFLYSIRLVQKSLAQTTKQAINFKEMHSALLDASRQLIGMDLQLKTCQKSNMKAKIKLYKDQLNSYKRKVKDQQQTYQQLQTPNYQAYEKVDDTSINPLLQAKRLMYQNEAFSNQAAVGIQNNNQKLIKSISRIQNINHQLATAKQLLGSIQHKISKNKYTLWGTLSLLLLVFTFILYTYAA